MPGIDPEGTASHRPAIAGRGGRRGSAFRNPDAGGQMNESGLGSSADGESEEGIDRSFERAGTPLHLGE